MAPPKPPQSSEKENSRSPRLIKPRNEVVAHLQERIDRGEDLQDRPVNSAKGYEQFDSGQKRWHDRNQKYLESAFDSKVVVDKYTTLTNPPPASVVAVRESSVPFTNKQIISHEKKWIREGLVFLEALLLHLEWMPEASQQSSVSQHEFGEEVFIVHGHDEAAKQSVARFVEQLELKAVILHEQPNQGKTGIEKLEDNARNAGFAIILLTPDNIGSTQHDSSNPRPRARQNVVLELGYFCGKLGRDRVMILNTEGVEAPSNFAGVVYTSLIGSWRIEIARELRKAGLPVDMNKAL